MVEEMHNFYSLSNIDPYENIHLLDLSESCAALEEQVLKIAGTLSPVQQQIIIDYILTRNDLELETFKTALRWGKKHYL